MKKVYSFILCLATIFVFSACSSSVSNSNYSSTDISETTTQSGTSTNAKTVSWMGNEYPINIDLNFVVQDVVHTDEEESGINLVIFCSMDYDEFSDNIENYDFSNGYAQAIGVIYNLPYNEIVSGNAEILGTVETVFTGKSSDSFTGWYILYDPDGEVIFKTDVNTPLECGLHKNYYDKDDISIASYSGWDDKNATSLWTDSNGSIINETELRELLESMCPNEYLRSMI